MRSVAIGQYRKWRPCAKIKNYASAGKIMATTTPLPSASALPAKSTAAAKDEPPSGLTSDEARRRLEI